MKMRETKEVVTAHEKREGGGFTVRRPFPSHGLRMVDPFLMLDELGPVMNAPGEAVGAPDHPHRGFETVSYLLEGSVEHRDSAGHAGSLGPGDVQWMTAGDGIVHSEMPSDEMRRDGGRMHAFQLWVNLPQRDKRMAPRYQEISAEKIPVAQSEDGKVEVSVIAGQALGVSASIETRTPILYHHYRLQPDAKLTVPVPADFNLCLYVFEGEILLDKLDKEGGQKAKRGQLAVFEAGDAVALHAGADGAQALLLGGVPLREPVAFGGPFVMNTRAEVEEAYADFQAGRMGQIPAQVG